MRSSHRSFALLSFALSLSLYAHGASAQALTPQDEANARFQAGLKYYDARDFESARLAFTQAYAVMQKPGILLNLGLSEIYSGHVVEGLTHLEEFLKDGALPADKKERAKKGIDDAWKKTGHLSLKSTRDAELKVDGRAVAPGTTVVHVLPGPHKVEAKLGDKSKTADVDASAGVTTTVDVQVDDGRGGAAAGAGGGASEPFTPPPAVERDEGSFWGWRSITGLVLIAGSGVALGVGLAAKSTESDEGDRAKSLSATIPSGGCAGGGSPQCPQLYSALESRNEAEARAGTFFLVSGLAFGAGAAFIVSSVIRKHRTSAINILPSAGPQHAGLSFTSPF